MGLAGRVGTGTACLVLLSLVSRVSADSWEAPERTEYPSPHGKHVLCVTPDPKGPLRNGWCLGELYRIDGAERQLVWKRYLINNVAPVDALVSDSGLFVITLDEWHYVGTFPIVLYRGNGEFIKVFDLETLLTKDDSPARSVSSVWWRNDALMFFDPDESTLFIRLNTGRTLMIWLRDGDLMNEDWFEIHRYVGTISSEKWQALQEYAKKRASEEALARLESKEARQRQTGAILAGQLGLREAIPRLQALLKDDACDWQFTPACDLKRNYYVAKAAEEALEKMGEKVSEPSVLH